MTQRSIQSLGGEARAKALTSEERSEIAREAAATRWNIPRAPYEGELTIGDSKIPCAVLEDGTRVLTQRGMVVALGMYKNPNRGTRAIVEKPVFLAADNLNEFISNDLKRSWTPIQFRVPKGSGGYKGNIAIGYRAEILPLVCHVYLDAKEANKLHPRQEHIAAVCKALQRALSIVSIVALVDEATGYQELRDRKALQAILDRYLRKELAAWARRFPPEFYEQLFKLRSWEWKGMKVNRPQIVGKYTNDLVYERLAPGILKELEQRNPKNDKGIREARHHQWLTEDVGHPALAQHLYAIIGFMRVATSWDQFYRMVQKAFPKKGETLPLLTD